MKFLSLLTDIDSCATAWTAVGAVGQILCAAATFVAALIALKSYKLKVKIRFKYVTIKEGDESTRIPIVLEIRNVGGCKCLITEYGVSDGKIYIALNDATQQLDTGTLANLPIGKDDLCKSVNLLDAKKERIKFYAVINNNKVFMSRNYKKTPLISTNQIDPWCK